MSIFLILLFPVAGAVIAASHGLWLQRQQTRAFDAHSERLRAILDE